MTDRPILFSAPMVRALLDGRKTQTRRVLKPQHERPILECFWSDTGWAYALEGSENGCTCVPAKGPRFAFGDRLWVKERCFIPPAHISERDMRDGADTWPTAYYAADDLEGGQEMVERCKWRHRVSIHMPRWASRLTLTVTDVRVERLQAISEADAIAEGVVADPEKGFWVPGVEHPSKDFPWLSRSTARGMYAALWDAINGSGEWLADPWVVAVSFDVRKGNIDA